LVRSIVEQYVFARVVAKPGSAGVLGAAAEALVPSCRSEDGNLSYALFRANADENEYWFSARWRDAASLEAHGRTAHVATWLGVVAQHAVSQVEVHETTLVA
jgi:quinol monooxygenase YgiN